MCAGHRVCRLASGLVLLVGVLTGVSPAWGGTAANPASLPIDAHTLDHWAAPYQHWSYRPEPVLSSRLLEGTTTNSLTNPEAPAVFRIPGSNRWYMSFAAFNGKGSQPLLAESDDLIHWKNFRLTTSFAPDNCFDHGGCLLGGFLYDSWDIKAPRQLQRREGRFWSLYGAYSRQGGYAPAPGSLGMAVSVDGLTWSKLRDQPALSVFDADTAAWEQSSLSQPWLLEHNGRFFAFYSGADGRVEQSGLAFSTDLTQWMRYPANPILPGHKDGSGSGRAAAPKVFRDGDHWSLFYSATDGHGTHLFYGASRDLVHWAIRAKPLYASGGHPRGLDKLGMRELSLVYNPANDTFYLFYVAAAAQKEPLPEERSIGLITSKPIP